MPRFDVPSVTLPVAIIAASGTTQAGSALIATPTVVVNAATGATGVMLNASIPVCDIRSRGTTTANVYPPSGEQIEYAGGINLPVTLLVGSNVALLRDTSTTPATWRV